MKYEPDHLLVAFLSNMLYEAGGDQLFPEFVGSQAIFGKAVVEVLEDYAKRKSQFCAMASQLR